MPGNDVGLFGRLWRHRLLLAVGLAVAAVATLSLFASIRLFPPSIHAKAFGHSIASTEVSIGLRPSLRSDYPESYVMNYAPRAQALADMVASPQILGDIGRAAHVSSSKIALDAPLWTNLQRAQVWDTGPKRARQIVSERDPYRITLSNDPNGAPIIDVTAQAPTAPVAVRLAAGVAKGLSKYVSITQAAAGTPVGDRYLVSQVAPVTVAGPSRGLLVNAGAFVFLGVFVLWAALVLYVTELVSEVQAAASPKVRGGLERFLSNRPRSTERTGASTPSG